MSLCGTVTACSTDTKKVLGQFVIHLNILLFLSCLQRNLTEYFVAVDINNMLQLYASMLHERRIIITSSKLSTVSPYLQLQ